MAIVLALLIVGWLVAFALGNQVGLDSKPVTAEEPQTVLEATDATPTSYRESVSAS